MPIRTAGQFVCGEARLRKERFQRRLRAMTTRQSERNRGNRDKLQQRECTGEHGFGSDAIALRFGWVLTENTCKLRHDCNA